MRRFLPVLAILLLGSVNVHAKGLLIPADKSVPPLAMVNHRVVINIDDQVATTRVEQTFRNHTERQLEATYIFPVPKGASVNKFTMWVDGKEVAGELLDAPKARQIYTDIVRRTQDPGLLEYLGHNLFRLRVFPIPPRGDQKVALSFTSVASSDSGLIEYIYPLKTDGKATATLDDFSIKATIKSQHAVQNVYSPTHSISISRANDKELTIAFEREQAMLDKDFQLFYSLGDKDVGLTALGQRPVSTEDGYFMLLLAPKLEMSEKSHVPRDVVLVLDTSGSMAGVKMEQARKAVKYCLDNLKPADRFGVLNFASTVNKYRDGLVEASSEQLEDGKRWCDRLRSSGGTAIHAALMHALALRTDDTSRTFTIVFFTDGQPTIGETDCDKILKDVAAKNTANTRIFAFGVGESDGINIAFLDQLADSTRAISTYVRPAEDIEVKTTSLVKKISHPVLANLKLSVTPPSPPSQGGAGGVSFAEVYPPQLPDLFHGGQLTVFGRYTGSGPVAIKLTGTVGKETREFVYETTFAPRTSDDKSFVEDLWARRKVGFLLDQIRRNGEKKELVDEVVALAKKYGIATPYTSYLVVPDSALPVAQQGRGAAAGRFAGPGAPPPALASATPAGGLRKVDEVAKDLAKSGKNGLADGRDKAEADRLNRAANAPKPEGKPADDAAGEAKAAKEAQDKKKTLEQAREALQRRDRQAVQTEKLGVDLAVQMNNLRNQNRIEQTAQRRIANRTLIEVGGIWIDTGFTDKTPTLVVKAQSDAYFRILEKQAQLKEVFRLGNHLVYVTPSGTAIIVDANDGKDKLGDEEIDPLFVAKK